MNVPKRHPRGREITDRIGQKFHELQQYVEVLTPEERSALLADLRGLSTSNCAYWIYENADAIRFLVNGALKNVATERRARLGRIGIVEDV